MVGRCEGIGGVVGVAVVRPVRGAAGLTGQEHQCGQRRSHLGEPGRWEIHVGRPGGEVRCGGRNVDFDEHSLVGQLSRRGHLRPDLGQLRGFDHILGVEGHQSLQGGKRVRLLIDGIQGDQQGDDDGRHHRGPAPSARRPPPGDRHHPRQEEGETPDIGRPGKVRRSQRPHRGHQGHQAGDHRGYGQTPPQLALPAAGPPVDRSHQKHHGHHPHHERKPAGHDRDVHTGPRASEPGVDAPAACVASGPRPRGAVTPPPGDGRWRGGDRTANVADRRRWSAPRS